MTFSRKRVSIRTVTSPVGDVAYMAVKISTVNDRHNAKSRTTDDDFAIGEESEHKVNHAQFFFSTKMV